MTNQLHDAIRELLGHLDDNTELYEPCGFEDCGLSALKANAWLQLWRVEALPGEPDELLQSVWYPVAGATYSLDDAGELVVQPDLEPNDESDEVDDS